MRMMETNLPGIYAIAISCMELACSCCLTEEKVAAITAEGRPHYGLSCRSTPSITFPEVCLRRSNWAQAKEQYPDARRALPLDRYRQGVAIGETEGLQKLLWANMARFSVPILSVPMQPTLSLSFHLPCAASLTVDEISETIHPHPTLSEGIREAVLAVEADPFISPQKTVQAAR